MTAAYQLMAVKSISQQLPIVLIILTKMGMYYYPISFLKNTIINFIQDSNTQQQGNVIATTNYVSSSSPLCISVK
jgi:hypothetical protein